MLVAVIILSVILISLLTLFGCGTWYIEHQQRTKLTNSWEKALAQENNKIYTLGRWARTKISYDLYDTNELEKKLILDVIKQINDFKIVKLVPAKSNETADITIYNDFITDAGTLLGHTDRHYYDHQKGLLGSATIQLYTKHLWPLADNTYAYQNVVAHEIGHALGLAHNKDATSIMSPTTDVCYGEKIPMQLDTDYIRTLVHLYGKC